MGAVSKLTPLVAEILRLSDEGEPPDAIAETLRKSLGCVYAHLRKHRPDRARKPRPRTSTLPFQIRALAAAEIKPARIAQLKSVSRAYVYRCLEESNAPSVLQQATSD